MSDYNAEGAFGLLRSYSRHRDFVRAALKRVADELEQRAIVHDASKLLDDEFAGFSRINAVAREQKFGSPEYTESMQRERGTIDLHFSRNSHHPERPKLLADAIELTEAERGICGDDFRYWHNRADVGMTFLDVIEMVCDWYGARLGYDDPRPWAEGFNLNMKSKGSYLSPDQQWLARSVAVFLGAKPEEIGR